MFFATDITPLTYLDYPKKAACIIWFSGCNIRCPYCYNPDLSTGSIHKGDVNILEFLNDRNDFLDAVVLSGGEVTLYKDLENLCKEIKNLGYLIKIDTNGRRPDVVKTLIDKNLIDYIAIDFKAHSNMSLTPYGGIKGYNNNIETIKTALFSNIPFEVRTTVHPAIMSEDDIIRCAEEIHKVGYDGIYYLQWFFDTGNTLGNLGAPSRFYDVKYIVNNSPLEIQLRNFPLKNYEDCPTKS